MTIAQGIHRGKVLWIALTVVALAAVAAVSFRYGVHTEHSAESVRHASTQAVLALGHHKSYERIESLLARKCYEAALTEARELRNLQLVLVSENLRASGNDPEVVDYIRSREPKVLDMISAGPLPELKSYTTTCP